MEHPEEEIKEVEDVLELCQGAYTGTNRDETYNAAFYERDDRERLFQRPPGVSEADALNGGPAPPGESQFDVETRVANFVDGLLDKEDDDGSDSKVEKRVAIFMHGVAIRCYMRRIL